MEDVKRRVEIGYTMAVYGTRESIHEQMLKDIVSLLEENEALRLHDVVGRSEQLFCDCPQGKGVDIDEDGFPYCIDCQKNIAK